MIRGRPLQYAMVLLLACLAACKDQERWEAIIDRTLTLDSVKTINHGYWVEQTGVSYNVLTWWDGHLLCKRDVQHDTSVKVNYLQEVDLAKHLVRPFTIQSYSRVVEVASGQGAVAALVDSNGARVIWRKRPGSNFTDIGIPDSFRMPSGSSTKHIAVCSTAILLFYGDTAYSWMEDSKSWRRSILGPSSFEFGFGAYTEIIPSPYVPDTSFVLANDVGEWGGSCFRVRLAPTGEVLLDRILANDNCQFLFSDRRSRLWMVGSLFHMGINHSWIRTVKDSISVTIMNQEASHLDSVSTRLRTRNNPSVVLNETGFISGACMTDTSLLFTYDDRGIYELRVQPGLYTPQSALRQLLRIKQPRGSHWRMLIADDRNGGVIIAPGFGGLLHVASLHDRPRMLKLVDR